MKDDNRGNKNTDRDNTWTLTCTLWIQTADMILSKRTRVCIEHVLYICPPEWSSETGKQISAVLIKTVATAGARGTPGAPEEGCRMLGAQVCLQCMLTELHTSQLFSACASPDVTQKEINAGDTCRSKCHWYVLEKQAWGCRSKHASHSCHRTWMSTFLLLPLSTKCSCWLWNVSAWVIHYQTWRWTAYTCVYLLAPQLACGLAADTR